MRYRISTYQQVKNVCEVLDTKLLRTLRKQQGFSIIEFSKKIKIPKYNKLERNNVPTVNIHEFHQIARYYNFDPITLAYVLKLYFMPIQKFKQFFQACKKLKITPKEAIEQFVESFIEIAKEHSE